MRLKTLKCPSCGAPLRYRYNRYIKCDYCRGGFVVENSQEDIQIMAEPELRTPDEIGNWNEFWEQIFKGGYYDIDEVKQYGK